MKYQFFIFKQNSNRDRDNGHFICKSFMETSKWTFWRGDSDMEFFNAEEVKGEIEKALTTSNDGKRMCQVVRELTPGRKEYLRVVTSYEQAHKVKKILSCIAIMKDLDMYDSETDQLLRLWGRKDDASVFFSRRIREITKHLQRKGLNLLLSQLDNRKISNKRASFVATLCFDGTKKLSDRIKDFYNALSDCLTSNETLICLYRHFQVISNTPDYEIDYSLEAYYKHEQYMGYMRDGEPGFALLHRMGCSSVLKLDRSRREKIQKYMNFNELVRRYPSPSDRYVAIEYILRHEERLQRKQGTRAYYVVPHYGFEPVCDASINFTPASCSWPANWIADPAVSHSNFSIHVDDFYLLAPAFEPIYPYLRKRIYSEPNFLSWEMMEEIVNNLKSLRSRLLRDSTGKKLNGFARKLDVDKLRKLIARGEILYPEDQETPEALDDRQLLCVYSKSIAEFYTEFINWFELIKWGYANLMIYVEGP